MAFSWPLDCSELGNVSDTLRKSTPALSTRLIFPKACSVSRLETFNLSGYDDFLISELFLFSFSPISQDSLLVHFLLAIPSVKCSFR